MSAVAGAAMGYVFNAVLLLFVYRSPDVAPGGLAFGQGNALWGSLSLGLAGTVIGGLVGYWRTVGTRRFFHDLGHLPATLGLIVRRDGATARVHLLWGAAVSLVAGSVISPWVGLFLAAGLMSSLPSLLGRAVSALVLRLWSDVAHHLSPAKDRRPMGLSGAMVVILGAALALGAGFFLPGAVAKLVFAAACAVAAVVSSRGIPPGTAALLGLVAAALADLAWTALHGSRFGLIEHAFADGPRYANGCIPGECVPGEMGSWGGAGHHHGGPADVPAVLARSVGGGIATGVGAMVGVGMGSALGAAGMGGGDGGLGLAEPPPTEPKSGTGPAPQGQGTVEARKGQQPVQPTEETPESPEVGAQGEPPVEASARSDGADDYPEVPEEDYPEIPEDASMTRSAVTDQGDDYPEPDAPGDTPDIDDLDVAGNGEPDGDDETVDEGEEPADADADDGKEAPDAPVDAPPPESPTPAEVEATNQAKRDKLHDIHKTLAGIEDVDKRTQLIGIVRSAARVDDQGVPQGDLDRIAAMVRDQTNPDRPPGMIEEALTQTKDFVKGVGEDVLDLGKAGVDMVKGAGRNLKDLAFDDKFGEDFWDGTYDTVTRTGKVIDKGISATVQFGKDLKDLAFDDEFSNDFWDVTTEQLDKTSGKIADKLKSVADEARQIGKELWNDPWILGDTMVNTFKDQFDPNKVAEAFRKGVPGGKLLFDAMDKSRPVTDRLRDGLLGAAEWAGAAQSAGDAIDLAKGGARALGGLGSDLADKMAGLGDNLAERVARQADDVAEAAVRAADDVGALGGRSAKAALPEGALPRVADKVDDAAAAVARKAEAAEDLLKAGDEAKRLPRTPGMPESTVPVPQGTVERGTHVRNIARQEGYRPNLVERLDFEPTHASGNRNVLGSTRGTGQNAEAVIHGGAFDEGPTSLRSTVKHEVDHVLQHGQLETQAAPHGPKADWMDSQGKWTPKGREMAEMEVRMTELDRNLVTRDNAIRRAGGDLGDKSTWPREALDADKEIRGARSWLENHGVGGRGGPGAPAVEPAGQDLYKVGRAPSPAVQSMQTVPGFENEEKARQWVSDFKKAWAGNPNLGKSANQFADAVTELKDKPGIGQLAKDLVQGDSTTAGASGALNWARANKGAIKAIEVAADEGRRGADFLLEHKDALGNVVREVAEVKTYNWSNKVYYLPEYQSRTAEKIVQQLAERASNPEFAGHGLRLAINDMDHMPPKLKDLIAEKLTQRGLSDRVKVESFNHFHNFPGAP